VRDFFAKKAKDYEKEQRRVQNVKNIANAIKNKIGLKENMEILDFGSGTGLLLKQIAPFVKKITAVDRSKSMNQALRESLKTIDCDIEVLEMDLERESLDGRSFDGIISSMTIHHVKDTKKLFEKFYNILKDDGFVALADLESEDGTFHSEDTGVCHFGFDKDEFANLAREVGFVDIEIERVSIIKKPHQEFGVFLMVAKK